MVEVEGDIVGFGGDSKRPLVGSQEGNTLPQSVDEEVDWSPFAGADDERGLLDAIPTEDNLIPSGGEAGHGGHGAL